MNVTRMPLQERVPLFIRCRYVDRVQRQRDFDQLLRGDDGVVHLKFVFTQWHSGTEMKVEQRA